MLCFLLHGFLEDVTDGSNGCYNINGFLYQRLDCLILVNGLRRSLRSKGYHPLQRTFENVLHHKLNIAIKMSSHDTETHRSAVQAGRFQVFIGAHSKPSEDVSGCASALSAFTAWY